MSDDRCEALNVPFLSCNNFADVIPKFLKRRGLVALL